METLFSFSLQGNDEKKTINQSSMGGIVYYLALYEGHIPTS